MNKPWNGYRDYTDDLPQTHIRPTEPQVDLPEWAEGVMVILILAVVALVLVLTILPALSGHPVVSQ